jgi:ABC-type nitrate/sulfonate/bicarbonate transport system substrate-binding protein
MTPSAKKAGFLALLVVVLASTTLTGCGGSESSSNPSIKIGYGYSFSVGAGPDEIGFDILKRKYGVTPKLEEMASPTTAITALDRGDIQVLNVGMSTILPAFNEGAEIRILLPAYTYSDLVAVGRPGITSAKQLRGKAFLISSTQSASAAFAYEVVKRAGLAKSDVSFPTLRDSTGRLLALKRGRVDATLLDTTDYQRLVLEGGGYTLLGRARDIQPPGPSNVWAVQKSFIDKHPDQVQKIVDALVQGYAQAYTPAGRARFLKEAEEGDLKGADPRLARKIYAEYKANGYWVHGDSVFSEPAYKALMAVWLRYSVIEKVPAFSDLWEVSFWKKAVASS